VAEQQRQREISGVLSAPDALLRHEGQVTVVVMSASRDAGVVVLGDLPDPGPAQAYQLWAIRGETQMTEIGLLRPGQRTATVLITNMTGAEGVGVSLEPAHGSRQPSPGTIVQTVKII
jgi:anti-sigma-K factor RskA